MRIFIGFCTLELLRILDGLCVFWNLLRLVGLCLLANTLFEGLDIRALGSSSVIPAMADASTSFDGNMTRLPESLTLPSTSSSFARVAEISKKSASANLIRINICVSVNI